MSVRHHLYPSGCRVSGADHEERVDLRSQPCLGTSIGLGRDQSPQTGIFHRLHRLGRDMTETLGLGRVAFK